MKSNISLLRLKSTAEKVFVLAVMGMLLVSLLAACGPASQQEPTDTPLRLEPESTASTQSEEETEPTETTLPEETEPIHIHDYAATVTAPTCTEEGYTLHTCAGCGSSYRSDISEARGHTFRYMIVEPTYTSGGYVLHTCTECGYCFRDNYTDKLEQAHTHSYSETVIAPTCTEDGCSTFSCGCGESYIGNVVAAAGHDFSVTTIAAMADAEGYDLHTCQRCGETYKDNYTGIIPGETEPSVTEHVHVYLPDVIAPTCLEKGYTLYSCACGDGYTDNETAPTGHTWGEWVRTKEPSGSEEGEETRSCACGAEESRVVAMLQEDPSPANTSGSYAVTEVLDIINAKRAEAGLYALTYNSDAQECANIRAAEISQYFSHSRPDGSDCFTILEQYGLWGECIASGYATPAAVVEGWMSSNDHRGSLMADFFTCAVVARNGCGWVILFG